MSRLDKFSHRPQTRLIALENTHNASGGTVLPLSYTQEICAEMYERGVSVPLDGTRIFNAAAALGEPMRSLTESFDSVALIVVRLGGFLSRKLRLSCEAYRRRVAAYPYNERLIRFVFHRQINDEDAVAAAARLKDAIAN